MFQAGTYHGYLKNGVTGEAQSGGLQMVLQFAVENVLAGNDWQPIAPANRTVYLPLSEAAWPYSEKKLKALGFNGDFTNPQFSPDASEQGVSLLCKIEEYQGKTKEKWDLADWGSPDVKQAGEDKLRRLNAMWGKGGSSAPPAGKPKAPPAGKPVTGGNGTGATPTTNAVGAGGATSLAASAGPAAGATKRPSPPRRPTTGTTTFTTKSHGSVEVGLPGKTWTRDEAWKDYCAANNDEPNLDEWNQQVAAVAAESGKAEEQFGPDEWKRVADLVGIPF